MRCRHCASEVNLTLIDLGTAPPSNAYLTCEALKLPEKFFPLRVLVCEHCWLVQTEDFTNAHELFNDDYAYFSSVSKSWLSHCEKYVEDVVMRFHLNQQHHVIEVAANDGYLLQYVKARGITCTGIEPTASTARVARLKGMQIIEDFFGTALAKQLILENKQADLMVANNVLAHVPNINDFVAGFSLLLKDNGVATFEFPHLLRLMEKNQFDTIYHEHFSYLSLTAIESIFNANGLFVFDVEEIGTHGGSLRVFAQRVNTGKHHRAARVSELLIHEKNSGIDTPEYYGNLQKRASITKNEFLNFLLESKKTGSVVAGYGAAAKGNTLLNYASIRSDLIPFIIDKNPNKQGKYMPGSRIPIFDEEELKKMKPDYIVIFPWNLHAEIMQQLRYVKDWGGKFVIAIPQLEVFA